MAVPLTLLMLFTYIPFLEMFKFSFYNMKYSGTRTFVGLKNYMEVFSRDDCFKSLLLAFYYVAASFVQLALALYFATIFCFKLHGKEVFKGLLFFPYLVCGIAIGFIFKFFFTRGFVLDTVLGWIGMPLESLPYWLRDTRINNISLVFTLFEKRRILASSTFSIYCFWVSVKRGGRASGLSKVSIDRTQGQWV